jgi:hypothetical protein
VANQVKLSFKFGLFELCDALVASRSASMAALAALAMVVWWWWWPCLKRKQHSQFAVLREAAIRRSASMAALAMVAVAAAIAGLLTWQNWRTVWFSVAWRNRCDHF